MSGQEAPRANRSGDPCPPWCVTDHGKLLIPGQPVFGYDDTHASDPVTAELAPTSVMVRRRPGQKTVTVDIDRVVNLVSLTPDRAKALADVLACLRSWEDVGQLAGELRAAASVALGADGPRGGAR